MRPAELDIEQYYSEQGGRVRFTREQASRFAKQVANDFNPLHDADAKRFCVPGDLLFAVILARYGVSGHMEFVFSGMVTDEVELMLPAPAAELHLQDGEGREYLRVTRTGESSRDPALISRLTQNYVAFSGQTFPHILVPLLAEQQVMINPERPMVIYQSMSLTLDRLDIAQPVLQVDSNRMDLAGKRGSVDLAFHLVDGSRVVGHGRKHMLVSGLKAYDESVMASAIDTYNDSKRAFALI